jgi:hypothetical protein
MDVIFCVPTVSQDDKPEPQNCLKWLIILLRSLPGGESRYFPLLMAKIEEAGSASTRDALVPLPITILRGFLDDVKVESISNSANISPSSVHRFPESGNFAVVAAGSPLQELPDSKTGSPRCTHLSTTGSCMTVPSWFVVRCLNSNLGASESFPNHF